MTNKSIKADTINSGKANAGELTVKVNVDAEDFVKGMKMIQRLTRETTKDLRALEKAAREFGEKTEDNSLVISDGFMRLGELAFYKDPSARRRELLKRYVGELFELTVSDNSRTLSQFKLREINEKVFNDVLCDNPARGCSDYVIEKERGEGASTSIIAAARVAPERVIVIKPHRYLAALVRKEYGIDAYGADADLSGKDFRDKIVVVDYEENVESGVAPVRRVIDSLPECKRVVRLHQKMNETPERIYIDGSRP